MTEITRKQIEEADKSPQEMRVFHSKTQYPLYQQLALQQKVRYCGLLDVPYTEASKTKKGQSRFFQVFMYETEHLRLLWDVPHHGQKKKSWGIHRYEGWTFVLEEPGQPRKIIKHWPDRNYTGWCDKCNDHRRGETCSCGNNVWYPKHTNIGRAILTAIELQNIHITDDNWGQRECKIRFQGGGDGNPWYCEFIDLTGASETVAQATPAPAPTQAAQAPDTPASNTPGPATKDDTWFLDLHAPHREALLKCEKVLMTAMDETARNDKKSFVTLLMDYGKVREEDAEAFYVRRKDLPFWK